MGSVGPFSIPGFTWGAAGVWTLVAMVAMALIKTWPILAKQAIEARTQIRKEKRDDLSDCQRRLDEMAKQVKALGDSFNDLKIELSATLSAYRILEIEVENHNPGSIGLAEARAVLSAAFMIAPSTRPERRDD